METMNNHLKKVQGSAGHCLRGNAQCPLPDMYLFAGTPFWKLVLKQFDDLLVKVG